MGLTDELYIKMNSRGKPLTEFEHFKAEWENYIKKIDEASAERISRKIDIDWTDVFWPYRGDNNIMRNILMNVVLVTSLMPLKNCFMTRIMMQNQICYLLKNHLTA